LYCTISAHFTLFHPPHTHYHLCSLFLILHRPPTSTLFPYTTLFRSFMNRLREIKLKWKAPLTLGLTDETFAVASFHKKEAQMENGVLFYTVLFILSYISWVGGSFLGGVLGEIVP